MYTVTVIDDIGTEHFSATPTIKRKAQRRRLSFEHSLPPDIADSSITGGAEFEFYVTAFDEDDFDRQLKSIIAMLYDITDRDILCNPFREFDRSREHDKLIIKPDSSLNMQRFGVEITTPIVPVMDLPYYIDSIFDVMRRYNAVTNESTGFHIHLSCPDMDGESFDFLGLMLLLNEHGLYETWPPRPDYSRNVMDVLNCLDFEAAAQKKDEIGRGWCVIRPEAEIKPTHIEIRTMGGEGYHLKMEQVYSEFVRIVKLYLSVLNADAAPECAVLIERQRAIIDEVDEEKIEKLQKTLAFIGYVWEESAE